MPLHCTVAKCILFRGVRYHAHKHRVRSNPMLPDKGLAVGRDVDAVGLSRRLPHLTAGNQVGRAAHEHHRLFAGPHKHVDRLAVVEAAPSALGAKDGVAPAAACAFPERCPLR